MRHDRFRNMPQRQEKRLRVGEIRIFYDVSAGIVEGFPIVSKSEAGKWLEQFGSRD